MIDVEFATLGIIRCNIGDSAKCEIAFERVEGNRECLTALGVLWFPAALFFHPGNLTTAIKTKT